MPGRPGAAGDLDKRADSGQLIGAIHRVAQSKLFITPGVAAERMVLSSNTASSDRARILETTGVHNDVVLALYAMCEGL